MKNNKADKIYCVHYSWILYQRDKKFYADGRGNKPPLGRHSLDTYDRDQAVKNLAELDLVKATETGLVQASPIHRSASEAISFSDGRRLYEAHLQRPEVARGPSKKTRARYRAVLDKLLPFLQGLGIGSWNGVNPTVVNQYLAHLQDEGYAEATLYLEGTTIKQIVKYLIDIGHLADSYRLRLPLRKPNNTTTFCYTLEQFQVMLDYCQSESRLHWIHDVILGLGFTGLRVGELASLRWRDVDLSRGMLNLTNDPARRAATGDERRRTKSRQDRSLPINKKLWAALRSRPHHADGYIFRGPRGGRLDPDSLRVFFVSDVIKPLTNRFPSNPGEVGFSNGRLHSFRHFFCSWAANQGVPERALMSWLGHSDSAMIKRYYHLHQPESRAYMDRLELAASDLDHGVLNSPAA